MVLCHYVRVHDRSRLPRQHGASVIVVMLNGVPVRKQGTRFFAIPRALGLADRIAEASHSMLNGNRWQAIMRQPIGGHVICNQKRADARRGARWARGVVKARFT